MYKFTQVLRIREHEKGKGHKIIVPWKICGGFPFFSTTYNIVSIKATVPIINLFTILLQIFQI